jgi:hypothetical protein
MGEKGIAEVIGRKAGKKRQLLRPRRGSCRDSSVIVEIEWGVVD